MMRIKLLICLLLFTLSLFGCVFQPEREEKTDVVNAAHNGLSTENSGVENSKALQALIDRLSENGGTVYIPAGEYEFAENGRQTIGSHCIKMRSNVSIVGDGESTVLKPVGNSQYGLDMFYFNDYLDTGEAVYLENCRFDSFVIDAAATSCQVYTSAGKGFMFNLFKNCHWKKVTVKNTDATGFGVDCPINGSITDCTAIGCGKAATEENGGASGFGIGFGYCEDESMTISGCTSLSNKKFGFFFEHQGRFNDEKYGAESTGEFTVTDCIASGNLYNFGGICSMNTLYENCHSKASRRYGFLFENSINSGAVNCQSENEKEACFAILQTPSDGELEVSKNEFLNCVGRNSPVGVKIVGEGSFAPMSDNRVANCDLSNSLCAVYTSGKMHSIILTGNLSETNENELLAEVEFFTDIGNSWNE